MFERHTGTATPQVSNLPVPGQFTVFTQPGSTVTAGTNLASLPFQISQSSAGQLPQAGGAFGAGTIGSATIGGVLKSPTIFAHPPGPGWATFSWVVNLPSASGLQIGWSAGIDDNAPVGLGCAY